jgi:hypothetical protein
VRGRMALFWFLSSCSDPHGFIGNKQISIPAPSSRPHV